MRAIPAIPVLPVAALLFCLPALIALADQEWGSDTGSLTPLVLITGVWTLWRAIGENAVLSRPGPMPAALFGLGVVIVLYVLASAIGQFLLMAAAAWAGCALLLWARHGSHLVWAVRFPLAYLGLAIPLPYSLTGPLNADLRATLSEVAVRLAEALGMEVAIETTSIFVRQYRLAVEAACAGANATFSLIAIVLLFSYWYRTRDWRRTLLVSLCAVPIAMGTNVLRVLLLIVVVDGYGVAVLDTVLHPLAGLISFAIALGLFLLVDRSVRAGLAFYDRRRGR